MTNKTKKIFILLVFSIITSNSYGQSEYSSGLYLKSIQADFTSLILINSASLYSDFDFLKSLSKPRSYGLRMSIEIIDFNSISGSGDEGFPTRNLSLSMRASTKPSFIHMNGLLSFVNTSSVSETIDIKDGNNLRAELEASTYFFDNILGIKFKLYLPVFNFQGEQTSAYIGIGIVIGYLNN